MTSNMQGVEYPKGTNAYLVEKLHFQRDKIWL